MTFGLSLIGSTARHVNTRLVAVALGVTSALGTAAGPAEAQARSEEAAVRPTRDSPIRTRVRASAWGTPTDSVSELVETSTRSWISERTRGRFDWTVDP